MATGYGCGGGALVPMYVMLMALLISSRAISRLEAKGSCVESERRALLAVGADMYDPSGDWLASWTGDDCCTWRGVACDGATGHVTKLDLRFPYLDVVGDVDASRVNPSLLELTHLKYLDLSMNNFSSAAVPETFASLVHLEYLNLSSAMFAGAVPPRLGNLSALRYLDLNGCYGDLHVDDLGWLSHLPYLRYLDMSCVDMSLATNWFHSINSIPSLQVLHLQWSNPTYVPPTLPPFNLTSITMLDLSGNLNINTSILDWLSNASTLEHLQLGSCGGFDIQPLQPALAALTNLLELDLSANDIEGEIYGIVGNASKRLRNLDLQWNKLTGDIARILVSLRHLEYLVIDNNQITGHLPEMLGNLSSLRYLSFSSNQISGDIPQTVGNLLRLEFIYFSGNNLSGEIPQSIGNLTNLIQLYLGRNTIAGSIPESIGNLRNLEELYLSHNSITGHLPPSIGNLENLQAMYLQNNFITGRIPATVGGLRSLRRLDMSSNSLTGNIPRGMGSLCNLEYIDLSDNNVAGELADLIDGLSNCSPPLRLSSLHVSNNNLSGIIPPSLGQLSELSELYLPSNSLVGNVTESHFANLAILKFLDISQNTLRVILPDDWVPPFDAFTIGMSSCHLGTIIPSWIRTQTSLENLYLSRTGLWGTIPAWFSGFNPSGWHYLDLSSNSLHGSLPVVRSVEQSIINLSNNSFSGPLPRSFAADLNPSILTLSDNRISGDFPPFFCNMTLLEVLDLSNNGLSGELPDCHSSYPTSLQSLHLNNNSLSGSLPAFLKHCKQLITLDLGENRLSGELPRWIGSSLSSLKVLRLRSNLLHGTISAHISNLTSLHVLDLSCNNLSGAIPSSIGLLDAMVVIQNVIEPLIDSNARYYSEHVLITTKGSTIEYSTVLSLVTSIDLSNNDLHGEIPVELTDLHGLHFLNLSKNHLAGEIPTDIGGMRQLESLDLSMNNLGGEIPLSLSALNFLSHMNLSYNHLSGRIPTSNQLQTLNDPSIYVGNKGLCGTPLPKCPGDEASQGPASAGIQEEDNSDKLEMILNIASIVIGFVVGFWGFVGTMIVKQGMRIAVFQWIDRIYWRLAVKLAKLKLKGQRLT
ncbi:receptor-like protein EIX2 isoform X1 [Musa acuminata AAA Group]|uniref:receptor-like protein EIX2 isoform X1 n=1 Tax=Musa acuminata AAA Group TaxID=214697 RepID=UPI0031DC340C